jgi:hypothetical protein
LAVFPLSDSDVVVIESRRPVGYSEQWDPSHSGLVVYSIDPSIAELNAGVQAGCGNLPAFPKWGYYLYPDSFNQSSEDCRDFTNVFVREGDTLTHGDLRISLEFSAEDLDYVTIDAAVAPE